MKLLRKIKNKLFRSISFPIGYKGKAYDLLMIDDLYPHPRSGFRSIEFTEYLSHFPNSKVLLSSDAYEFLKEDKNEHKKDVIDFLKRYPNFRGKLYLNPLFINTNTKLACCIFFSNMWKNLTWLEKNGIPFVFTLYPGGGFVLNDDKLDKLLKTIFSSAYFKKVIVTQKVIKDYLIKKKLCNPEKIEYIYGGIVPLHQTDLKREYFNASKNQKLNVCFCGNKYMEKGKDKGYDVFIEAAKELSKKHMNLHYHVIGGFTSQDIDVKLIENSISFHGKVDFENLKDLFCKMDVIISPNKPFTLNSGGIDGFPLGSIVEAVFSGSVAMISDELKQNQYFSDNEDLIIIQPKSNDIVEKVEYLLENPSKIQEIGQKGKIKFEDIFSEKNQLLPRIKVLKEYI